MIVSQFLNRATKRLEQAGITTARLDVLVLLEDALNTNRVQILADPDLLISISDQKKLENLLVRRAEHEPLAYIRNQTEFYKRSFYVDHHVLEPRSESETMIELAISLLKNKPSVVIDVGTGSGALAVTMKCELPHTEVTALDNDRCCLAVTRKNVDRHAADITVLKSDLLTEVSDKQLEAALLLCNLPYVPDNFRINLAATHEPRLAIYGGPDGLDLYRRLFKQLAGRTVAPHYVLTESLPPQHESLAALAKNSGFVLDQSDDFIQVFKMGTGSFGL